MLLLHELVHDRESLYLWARLIVCEVCESCESCEGCEGCETCEACEGCEGCETCEACEGCEGCVKYARVPSLRSQLSSSPMGTFSGDYNT